MDLPYESSTLLPDSEDFTTPGNSRKLDRKPILSCNATPHQAARASHLTVGLL
jgi:hypothetical protein